MRIQFKETGNTFRRLGALSEPEAAPGLTVAPILPRVWWPQESLQAQIEGSLADIDPTVAEQIRDLVESDLVFEAKERLLEYVVTEDHYFQIEAAAVMRRMAVEADERRFQDRFCRVLFAVYGLLVVAFGYWMFVR